MFITRILLVFLMCFCSFASAKHNDFKEFWILTNPEPPFVVQEKDRRLSGYLIDVIDGILKTAHIQKEVLSAPWERVESEARSKGNVMAFALARTEEREEHYHWITPLTANVYSVYTKKSFAESIENLSGLKTFQNISVLKNDARHNIMVKNGLANVSAFEDWGSAIGALLKGQADAIFFSDAGINYFCELPQHNCKDLVRVFLFQKTTSYLVMSKLGTDPNLVDVMMEAAKSYKSSSAYESVANQWITKYRQELTMPLHIEDGTLNLWKK